MDLRLVRSDGAGRRELAASLGGDLIAGSSIAWPWMPWETEAALKE